MAGPYYREWNAIGQPKGVFLLLHGMESHSGWFAPLGERLAAEGWSAVAYDRPGWGYTPGERGHLASYQDFVEEAAAMASRGRERVGPVHLVGMSWGGMAALYFALRRGWLLDSVSLLAPGVASKADLGLRDRLKTAAAYFRADPTRRVSPVFTSEHFTRDPNRRREIDADPLRLRFVSASFCLETLKMRRFIAENAGRRLLPPALCLLAGDDKIVENDRTGSLCRQAGARVETIPDAAHTLVFENPNAVARILMEHAAGADAARGSRRRRVWVVGGGAVGGAVGALLSFGGHEVGVLTRETHLPALAKSGFTLRCGQARRGAAALVAAARPEDLPGEPDLVAVAVKSYDTRAALAALVGPLPPRTLITSLQNGVDNEPLLAELFPGNPIAASAICAGLELTAPGRIDIADDRGGLGGAAYRGDPEQAAEIWRSVFPATGFECRWYSGPGMAASLKWSKLMLNTGFNALNAVTGYSSSRILSHPEYGPLAVTAIGEGFEVMRRLGLEPVDLPGYPVRTLRRLVRLPPSLARRILAWQAGRAAEVAFSMRQDVLYRRRHTELDDLNGRIVRAGRERGFDAKANAAILELGKGIA